MSGTNIETGQTNRMKRRPLVRELLHDRGSLLVIGGLGAPAWDITAARLAYKMLSYALLKPEGGASYFRVRAARRE